MHLRNLAPALLFPALAFTSTPLAAQVTPYGSGINPPGSLVVLSGVPEVGSTLVLGVTNTAAANPGPGLALLTLATAPAAGYPAGLVLPGFGLAGAGAPGELLLSSAPPDPLVTLGPVFWAGIQGTPASFGLPIPALPSLIGVSVYAQGGIVALAQGNIIGLTEGLRIQIDFTGPEPTTFLPIPAGTFSMGSDAPGGAPYFGPIGPVHQVTISQLFWMSRYEVTQAEFEALMGFNPSLSLGPDRPVNRVTWFQALDYCSAWNALQTGLGKVPSGYEYRLPTEAEWEYACRAGTTTEFHYGPALLCNQARFSYSYHSTPTADCNNPAGVFPVGSFSPNAWGLYDMHGNVWEWCLDSQIPYTASAKTDPYVSGGTDRVLRGGGWSSHSDACRSATRLSSGPGDVSASRGFRVVLAPVLVP